MVYHVRKYKIVPETGKEALEWLRKVARYCNEKWPKHPIELLDNFGGPQDEIRLVRKYESVGEFEEVTPKQINDEGIQTLLAERGEKIYFTDVVDAFHGVVEL